MPDKISNLGGYIRTSDKTKSSAVQTERMSAIPNPVQQAQITSDFLRWTSAEANPQLYPSTPRRVRSASVHSN